MVGEIIAITALAFHYRFKTTPNPGLDVPHSISWKICGQVLDFSEQLGLEGSVVCVFLNRINAEVGNLG